MCHDLVKFYDCYNYMVYGTIVSLFMVQCQKEYVIMNDMFLQLTMFALYLQYMRPYPNDNKHGSNFSLAS